MLDLTGIDALAGRSRTYTTAARSFAKGYRERTLAELLEVARVYGATKIVLEPSSWAFTEIESAGVSPRWSSDSLKLFSVEELRHAL